MPYSELIVAPMRQDLVRVGFKEMRTVEDVEATEKARGYFVGYPPSSPSVALMKDGEMVYVTYSDG